ncbi:MAG: glycoside hydrolase family 65 protein [Actinomycetota bacterium]|jgi:trehalose/maltose hydrolase-like predicted phosphorylase|nr:glycoside hydrolase family 65 protein [Actinomycetota bacterium]
MLEERKERSRSIGSNWTIAYEFFDPAEEGLREALTSTGNGYFCTRGTAEWADADDVHYPGTYVHGGYNRETTIMAGRPVLNEDLVNLPNWLVFKLQIEDELVSFDDVELLSYRHELDIRNATVVRVLRLRDRAGRETTLLSRRFVSMADMHQGAIEWTITPENWSGRMSVISALDGRVTNRGVARYRQLEGRHLQPELTRTVGPDIIALRVQTRQSHIYIAQAARTRVYGEHEVVGVDRGLYQMEDYIHQILTFEVEEKVPVRVEKMVAFYTSRDHAINEPLANAIMAVDGYEPFAEAFERHARAWGELWSICDMRIPKDDRVQLLIRLHISHVLQVCSPHTADLDAGVPARGLNGEAYRGHVFWDELYIYPFLNFRLPEITRELLMYRYRRLDRARAAAKEAGYRGAMYPWQSGSDGKEETQVVHLNPRSGRWDRDLSHNQRHINAAIFYNIWRYYQATDDSEFLLGHGAEMMLEIARFWSSIAHFNPERDRYEIHGIMGPDEFHEKYPGSEEEGLRNNAYTNVLVAWICETAKEVLDLLPERRRRSLCAKIGLSENEVQMWKDMSHRMFVPFHGDGIISQFEGYEQLKELDWESYHAKYGNIQRLDRILRAEGDTPDRYKLSKQADALMLFFLFSEEELQRLFERLGYEYAPDTASKNIAYYEPRTTHGSTLSFVVHAAILADLDPERAWEMFMTALESDVGDIQGGTTQEGIHMGVMAGTLDLIQRGYVGAEIRDGTLYFGPKLNDRLDGLSLLMRFRETSVEVTLKEGKLTVATQTDGFNRSIKVGLGDEVREIKDEERYALTL